MEIKFDIYFKKNLGTLFKSNEVDLNGKHAHVNIPLDLVDRMEVNYLINGNKKYTDDVLITDITENLIQIPFKSDVMKTGVNEFEIIAYMKNGDIKTSQTYIYNIEQGIGEGQQASNGSSSSDGHIHPNLNVLNSITQLKINEWDSKPSVGPQGPKGDTGEQGPQGPAGVVDTTNFYDKEQIDTKLSNIILESGNIVFRDIMYGEKFEIIADTDAPIVEYGNIIISATSLTVNENDTTTFTVKLDKAPINNQVVNISVNNAYCTLNKTNLTFAPNDYSIAQTVEVNGVYDSANYSDKSSIITVSSSNVSNKTVLVTVKNVDVEAISVTGVSLDKSNHSMKVDETIQLTATVYPSTATNKTIVWSSSNSNATVVNGLVTAKNVGDCVITASTVDGNKIATCNINITSNEASNDPSNSLLLFLNGEGNEERYDEENCLVWKDVAGNKDYTFVSNNTSLTNDRLKQFLWDSSEHINIPSSVTMENASYESNTNSNYRSSVFTWDIKVKIPSTSQTVLIGNGTNSINASSAFAITSQNGNLIVRGNYDKIAIINPLSAQLNINSYYRITVTSDGNVCRLYLDGEFIHETSVTSFDIKSGNFFIGKAYYKYIKYYNKALTSDEIGGIN